MLLERRTPLFLPLALDGGSSVPLPTQQRAETLMSLIQRHNTHACTHGRRHARTHGRHAWTDGRRHARTRGRRTDKGIRARTHTHTQANDFFLQAWDCECHETSKCTMIFCLLARTHPHAHKPIAACICTFTNTRVQWSMNATSTTLACHLLSATKVFYAATVMCAQTGRQQIVIPLTVPCMAKNILNWCRCSTLALAQAKQHGLTVEDISSLVYIVETAGTKVGWDCG